MADPYNPYALPGLLPGTGFPLPQKPQSWERGGSLQGGGGAASVKAEKRRKGTPRKHGYEAVLELARNAGNEDEVRALLRAQGVKV